MMLHVNICPLYPANKTRSLKSLIHEIEVKSQLQTFPHKESSSFLPKLDTGASSNFNGKRSVCQLLTSNLHLESTGQ